MRDFKKFNYLKTITKNRILFLNSLFLRSRSTFESSRVYSNARTSCFFRRRSLSSWWFQWHFLIHFTYNAFE